MKIAQCTYTQAGVEISLSIYFDLKAFDLIAFAQSEELMRLACDSIAAALPRENMEKHFYIKRLVKISNERLMIFCTDGFLVDDALVIPASQQAYANERIRLNEIDHLPLQFRLNNDLLKSMNDRLSAFEEETKKSDIQPSSVTAKESILRNQPQAAVREFRTEKSADALTAIMQIKKEIRDIAENNIKALKDKMNNLQENKGAQESLLQKINELAPINKNFATEADETIKRIMMQTEKLTLFRQYVINALYDAAKEFHGLILKKNKDAPLHVRKTAQMDFNKKFSGIAVMTEAGELSSRAEADIHLGNLSLESLQEVISSESKETPGLLQKCNTSWTEESPELQIVMKQLTQLNKTLASIFKDDPAYAAQQMITITRTAFPRSFQFKFSESAMNYKNVVDNFCKTQKEVIMNLANHFKKILQINYLENQPKKSPLTIEMPKSSSDLSQRKEVSDSILTLASKDHEMTGKYRHQTDQLYDFISKNIDPALKSVAERLKMAVAKMQTDAGSADKIMGELADIKSQIDININHSILNPEEKPDIHDLDQKIAVMQEKRNLLLSKNKMLLDFNHKLTAYKNIIKRIQEVDLPATKIAVNDKRDEAKQLLLQIIQNPSSNDNLKKRMLNQYAKVDASTAEIDKTMSEVVDVQHSIFMNLEKQPDISTESLEANFRDIAERIQALSTAVNGMNESVAGMRKIGEG